MLPRIRGPIKGRLGRTLRIVGRRRGEIKRVVDPDYSEEYPREGMMEDRELNEKVAEKVFGWIWVRDTQYSGGEPVVRRWFMPPTEEGLALERASGDELPAERFCSRVSDYSGYIACAFEVVREMIGGGWHVIMMWKGESWYVGFYRSAETTTWPSHECKSLEEAICVAALKVLGYWEG